MNKEKQMYLSSNEIIIHKKNKKKEKTPKAKNFYLFLLTLEIYNLHALTRFIYLSLNISFS